MLSIHPDDYDIERIRAEWIGRVVAQTSGRYPVEYDAIRRHCHMTGDTNPLFLNPEFAREHGPHGEVIVPPSSLPLYFASNGSWPRVPKPTSSDEGGSTSPKRPSFTLGIPTPGDRGINMGTEWEFHESIRVGDHLHSEQTVTDVFVKGIKLDPQAVWIVSEIAIFNQRDILVATWRNTTLVHRSPKQIEADAVSEKEAKS
ncbi:MAG: FAS1-like dehydratase domain-containing protein [Gammaproteobacteria bacterium]